MQGIVPNPDSKPGLGAFGASMGSLGVGHSGGVGAGTVVLVSEQMTIQGEVGQIKGERFRGEEKAEARSKTKM